MTSTAESKRVFKNHKLRIKRKWRYNVISAFSWSFVYICIYMILLNTLSGRKSCLVAPEVTVPPWATETILSTLVGGWWGQGILRAFTRCMMKVFTTATCKLSPGERKIMETEMTASARQRKATYHCEKERTDTDLEIFPDSNMLVRQVAFGLRLPFWPPAKAGARKLLSPYIFVGGVQLYVFTLSRFTLNTPKDTIRPFTSPSRVGSRNIRFRSLRTCVPNLWTSSFP